MTNDGPQLTPQQNAAIETRRLSVALSAGAGCGKTFVLTERFLSHLEPSREAADLGQLVAITFTERSAREMRGRIRQECHARLQQCAAAEVPYWLQIFRNLDAARISTIHAFCATLLRAHAVEANVDPQFSLLDETTSGSFLRNAVYDALLQELSSHSDDAMQLVLQHGLELTQDILESFVWKRFQIDFERWLRVDAGQLADRWRDTWHSVCIPQQLEDLAGSESTRRLIGLLHDNVPDHSQMRMRRDVVLETLTGLREVNDPAAQLQLLEENARVQGGGGKKAWSDETIYNAVRDGLKALRNSAKALHNQLNIDEDQLHLAAESGLLALRVAERAAQFYEQRKREAGLMDFDDLLLQTRNLLRDSESVRRRAAAGISMLMVDEFQDTDPVQAQIVRYLCGEQLTSGKLFLVGDEKQSIYRFRRADPAVFAQLQSEIPAEGRLPLSKNFRSQPAILNFVNALFAGMMGTGFEPLVAHATQLSPPPTIEFLFAVAEEETEATEAVKERAGEKRKREAEWIARRLHQILHDGVRRVREKDSGGEEAGLRPARPGDVAILFRAMTDVRYYEEALRDFGLDYYLVGGRAFYSQQEIFDLVNLCQYLDDCDDEISLAGVLRSPFFSLTDDTLFSLAGQASSLSAALQHPPLEQLDDQQQAQVAHAARVLAELRQEKDRLPLHSLLNLALQRTGYDASLLAEFLGKRKLANLRKLIEMARQFDRAGLFTLSDFVQRLRDSVSEQVNEELAATHPETSNVIRLMTVHQSKGLEFPIVVVADMDRPINPRGALVDFDPGLGPLVSLPSKQGEKPENLGRRIFRLREKIDDQNELVRLLYVATTRAADHLILSTSLSQQGTPTSPWMKLLAASFELADGQPAIDPDSGEPRIPAEYLPHVPEILVHTSAPQAEGVERDRSARLLPLNRLREAVEVAQPAPLPRLLQVVGPDVSQRLQFGVSELADIDAELRKMPAPEPDKLPASTFTDDDASSAGTLRNGSETSSCFRSDPSRRLGVGTDGMPSAWVKNREFILDTFLRADILGTLVHTVLERIDFRAPGDVKRLVDICGAAFDGQLDAETQRQAGVLAERFVASPIAAELARSKRCYRELEFLLRRPTAAAAGPCRFVTGFIDCLYESPEGEWTILDYKTGRMRAHRSDAEKLAVYEFQLGTYALAVRQLLNRLPDRAELVLLQDDCRRLALDLSDQYLERVETRIDAAMGHMSRRDIRQ